MDTADRFVRGDIDAFESLFRQHQGEVYRWIVRIVRHPGAAEELTIDTFWQIYQQRRRFDPKRPFGPWARRIATHAAIDYLRANREDPGETAISAAATVDPPLDPGLRDRIRAAFHKLPPRLRAAAALALIEEQPYAEIAAALDISASAVKMRVARAVRLLRKLLERAGVRP